jgi:hypothetical protein
LGMGSSVFKRYFTQLFLTCQILSGDLLAQAEAGSASGLQAQNGRRVVGIPAFAFATVR